MYISNLLSGPGSDQLWDISKTKRYTYGAPPCVGYIDGITCYNKKYPLYMLKHEKLSTGSESGFHKKMAAAARAGSGRSTDLGGSGWQQCRARLDGSSELGTDSEPRSHRVA